MSVALIAGIVSFLSPCVLPIVPPYLAYMSGVSLNEMNDEKVARRKAIVAASFFVMGLSTVFIFLGFAASAFGAFFLQNQMLFGQIAGVVIIIFGLHFIGVFRIPFLDQEARLLSHLVGRPALGHSWVRSWHWPRPRGPLHVAPCCWASTRLDWVFRSCWPRSSSAAQWA